MEDKNKLFAFRPGALLLSKLDQVKNVLGLTPSDVARKALNMGLERIIQQHAGAPDEKALAQMQCNCRGTLLTLIRKEQIGIELTRAEWGFLARMCYQTYDRLFHRINTIDRELLVANTLSFAMVMKLRDKQYPELAEHDSDRCYFGNMVISRTNASNAGNNLQDHISAFVMSIPIYPSSGIAAFSCRNFDVALRDEPELEIGLLNSALRPYLRSLLLVCLRGYWYENKAPIITPEDTLDGWRKSEEEQSMSNVVRLKSVSNEHFLFMPHATETTICGAIEARHHPFVFTLNDFVEIIDFFALLKQVGQDKGHFSMPGFEIDVINFSREKNNPRYMLASGRWRHFFSEEEFNALKALLHEFVEEPFAKRHMEKLEMIYGRV